MFQYATAKRLADHHSTSLKIDKSWFTKFQNPKAPAVRTYELDCFTLKPNFATRLDLARISIPPYSWKRQIIRKALGTLSPFYGLEDTHMAFQPAILSAPSNAYLEGFWISQDYFIDDEQRIRKDFIFKDQLLGKNLSIAKHIKENNSVSLHVRRGDYASHATINYIHGLTDLEYYHTAIKKIQSKVKDAHFFIFSDDPDWCKKNLKLSSAATYIDHEHKSYEGMHLMSLCQHHIIANSTYSWWGAWLNPSKDKLVIAPKKWFNDPKMNSKNVIPKTWIKI